MSHGWNSSILWLSFSISTHNRTSPCERDELLWNKERVSIGLSGNFRHNGEKYLFSKSMFVDPIRLSDVKSS